jgi:hypothetical protein
LEEQTNNNVNRRFADSELKPSVTADDDETKRKVTWLSTKQTL